MLYKSQFSDKNGKVYTMTIQTGTSTAEVPVTMSGNPCIIQTSSDRLFSPIKSRSCTLEIVVKDYIMDLYQTSSRGAKVRVKDDSTNNVIFFGYLTPNVYDQDYTYLDTVQLECRDAVSTLQDYKFSSQGIYPSYQTIISTILSFLKECGYEVCSKYLYSVERF